MVVCLEQGADLHMAQLKLLPLTVSCFSKIQIGFTFLVPAHLGSHGKWAVKQVCLCVYDSVMLFFFLLALMAFFLLALMAYNSLITNETQLSASALLQLPKIAFCTY